MATPATPNGQVSLDAFTALQVAAAVLRPKLGAAPRPWSTWHPAVKGGVVVGGIVLAWWGFNKLGEWLDRRREAGRREQGTTMKATWKTLAPQEKPASDTDALVRSGWPRSVFQ